MKGAAEGFGYIFTITFPSKNIQLSLKEPSFNVFARIESLMTSREPTLEDQARAISQFAKLGDDWVDWCRRSYDQALERRRRITDDEIIEYAFSTLEGQCELISAMINEQQPPGWQEIEKVDIHEKLTTERFRPETFDLFEKIADAAGVTEAKNPT